MLLPAYSRTQAGQVKEGFTLANDKVSVTIGPDGSLMSLRNQRTGQDYAGGARLWRL